MASILITGASRGIGFAAAQTLARAGHTVFATMRSAARVQELSATTDNLPIHFSVMDVDNDESVAAAISSIQASAPIDVLINNAGIERNGAIEDLSLDDIRATMETNYFGAVRCIKAVVPNMRERRSGFIINVTSVAGQVSTSPFGAYAASKFALEALSEALAQEMKFFGVRVAVVEPGIIDTEMAHGIKGATGSSPYPHQRRMADYFVASLNRPTPPSLVAEKLLSMIDCKPDDPEYWKFRHPVGPGAMPLLESRKATKDEDYIALQGADDDTWYSVMEKSTGMKLR